MKNRVSGLASLGGLVYSTEAGRMCPDCRQPVAQCTCKAQAALPQGDGVVRVSRETKGRGGKAVTLVKGVLLDAAGLTLHRLLAERLLDRRVAGIGPTVEERPHVVDPVAAVGRSDGCRLGTRDEHPGGGHGGGRRPRHLH